MSIIINLDVMLAKRKMQLTQLSDRVGITLSNLSILKQGKAKAIKLTTLDAICKALECQPGDILEYKKPLKMSGFSSGPLVIECLNEGDLTEKVEHAKKARLFLEKMLF